MRPKPRPRKAHPAADSYTARGHGSGDGARGLGQLERFDVARKAPGCEGQKVWVQARKGAGEEEIPMAGCLDRG